MKSFFHKKYSLNYFVITVAIILRYILYLCECFKVFLFMQNVQIFSPLTLQGQVSLPLSKSVANRAVMLLALSGANMESVNKGTCTDVDVMCKGILSDHKTVDIGACGTAMRFLTAYWATKEGVELVITGSERMKQRPIAPLVEALNALGANITYAEKQGYPPLFIKGKKLNGGAIAMSADISSQFVSALLMVAPTFQQGLTLTLKGRLVSKPYVLLTLNMMQQQGIEAVWTNENTIYVAPQTYKKSAIEIETDWSSAAFWYALVALFPHKKASLVLPCLNSESAQGDVLVSHIFSFLGVETREENKKLCLLKTNPKQKRFCWDFLNTPDLVQACVVACLGQGIHFCFTGLETLPLKETNRVLALQKECLKLGYVLEYHTDGSLQWNGKQVEPTSFAIDTHNDHRMAMAFVAFSAPQKQIVIAEPDVVSKSYPTFWDELKQLGYNLKEFTV